MRTVAVLLIGLGIGCRIGKSYLLLAMKIVLVEAFFSGSHRRWAEEFQQYSTHEVKILSLPGRHWKWRMHGGAISLAQQYLALDWDPDLILATDMVNASLFMAMIRSKNKSNPKLALYFHENQLTYPWSETDPDVTLQRDNHYAFINYADACVADQIFFNSDYHRHSFLDALPAFLAQFPDHRNLETLEKVKRKANTLHLGIDLKAFDNSSAHLPVSDIPRILWNHRWEYDKNPKQFFEVLASLQKNGIQFELIILGEKTSKYPTVFNLIKEKFHNEILHMGFVNHFSEYAGWIKSADLLPVTSIQDFFGISVVEAMYCGVQPLLPYRLAYPFLIPDDYGYKVFYQDGPELLERLENLMTSPKIPRELVTSWVAKYDWSNMIHKYDRCFTKVLDDN